MGWVFKLFQIDFGGDATSKYYISEFALGIEAHKLLLFCSFDSVLYSSNHFRFSKRDWTLVMSAFIIGVVIPLIIQVKSGSDKMSEKKLNKYDKAYLRIAKEWSLLSYCKQAVEQYCAGPYDNF
jgi:hypothetical protein